MSTAIRTVLPLVGGAAALGLFGVDHVGRAIAVATAMVLAWLLESIHPALVGFFGAFLFRATEAAEFETAFGGFATALPWMLFGVLLVLTAAEQGGIVRAAARLFPSWITQSQTAAILAIAILALALAWVVPHPLARAAILLLLVCVIAPPESDQRSHLGAVAAMGSILFSPRIGGTDELIIIVASAAALVAGAVFIVRGAGTASPEPASESTVDPAVALIVAVTAILWATTPYHRLQAELVGLAAGLLCAVVAIIRRWRTVTSDPLAMILAGAALSIPGVLIETEAAAPLITRIGHAVAWLGLPVQLSAFWTWTVARLFMLDGAVAIKGLAETAAPLSTAVAATTIFSLHQAPSLVLALAICGARMRDVLILGGAVFVVRSVLLVVL